VSASKQLCVLFLISSEGYFGAENMLVTLAEALERQECRCIVGVFSDSRFQHVEVADQAGLRGLEVELVPCAGRCDWRAVTHIGQLIAKHRVDVLHPHGYKADFYAYAAAWRRYVAVVATSHNWPNPLWSMKAYAVLDRWVMRNFDRVAVVSDVVAEAIRRSGVRAEKIRTIFNGIDCERFQSAQPSLGDSGVSEDEALIGFVGRFVPEKGGEILLRAARIILNQHPQTRFAFIGDGPCRGHWEQLAIELGIHKQVIFTGVREDMPGVYASLDFLVLPSLCEAMPMCVLEAMAAGKAVLASRVGAVPNLIDKHTGVLVDPGDVEALAAAIQTILRDPEQRRRLGQNASERVRLRFSSGVMAIQYLNLYREVIDRRQKAGERRLALGEASHV